MNMYTHTHRVLNVYPHIYLLWCSSYLYIIQIICFLCHFLLAWWISLVFLARLVWQQWILPLFFKKLSANPSFLLPSIHSSFIFWWVIFLGTSLDDKYSFFLLGLWIYPSTTLWPPSYLSVSNCIFL